MTEKSMLETVAASLPTTVTANLVAVFGSAFCPFAALLPCLTDSLASQRQSQRVDETLRAVERDVAALRVDLRNITDDQYKLTGECIVAALSTIDQQKLAFLRTAAVNALANPDLSLGFSDALARLIRDISAAEATFVLENFKYQGVSIDKELPTLAGHLMVRTDSIEEIIVGGLIRVGLLYARGTSWDSQMYEWSPLTAKLIALIKNPK